MPWSTSLLWPPTSERGSAEPSAMARNVVPGPSWSSTRSSQPVRTAVDAAPRSRQSCAWKWLRLASGDATACTAAIFPAFQNGSSGAIAGVQAEARVAGEQRAGLGRRCSAAGLR